MKEVKSTDTSPQPETQNQTKGKVDRRRIYSSSEERIRVNTEKFKPKSRARTQYKKKLIENGFGRQVILL